MQYDAISGYLEGGVYPVGYKKSQVCIKKMLQAGKWKASVITKTKKRMERP